MSPAMQKLHRGGERGERGGGGGDRVIYCCCRVACVAGAVVHDSLYCRLHSGRLVLAQSDQQTVRNLNVSCGVCSQSAED